MGFVTDIISNITGADDAATAQRDAASLASQATLASTEKNIDFQKWLWGEQKALSQPFVNAGETALNQYMTDTNRPLTLEELYADPGYQFGLSEGIKGVENSAAARGMQLSGSTLKGINRYATDYASTKYNEAWNRRQMGLDNLYRLIAGGQAAAAGQAAQGGQMGNQISSSINTAGQATAQMYRDIGNVNAAEQMSGWNTIMDVGNLYATYKGAKA